MRRTIATELVPLDTVIAATVGEERSANCVYDPATLASAGFDSLSHRIYDCYGRAARRILFERDTLDRLTILGLLGRTDDASRRRALFLALDPVWRSVNADDGASSPYRHLARLSARAWRDRGSPIAASSRALGVEPEVMERWLVSILERWRDVAAGTTLEPWDYHYAAGAASRALGARIPRERLRSINDSFYSSLGADPRVLRVDYDLDPRPGKTPVAYTTFGGRGGAWDVDTATRPIPYVVATYRIGGLDNLNELLHETGHAVHIAAIRTRPAFTDWPDSDPFTEALGDLLALEVYEPAWQWRWLGDSVPLAEGLRGRYGGIVLDIAWALFEVRMHERPDADPNEVWTQITRDYLHVRPHPELSWWAMRGQLVSSPGYMMNYAIGAIIAADIRQRMSAVCGTTATPNPRWYSCASEHLYRFGLERPSRQVIEDFLGRPISPDALLADMERMRQ